MLRTKATCNQSLVSIFPKNEKELLPELVFSNLEGRYEEIRKMTGDSGNDRRGLNMPLIRSIKFSYPKSISTQKEVIKKLDLLRSEIKKLEFVYQQKLNDLEELKKSILQKAFNGELKTSKISA
jgi:type I restriction enzyme S subunit